MIFVPKKQKVYVIDTNILIDYMDIIQDGEKQPIEPTIDLSDAHLVIPMVVIHELSKFKKEKSDRGKSARAVLRRLRELTKGKLTCMEDVYRLHAPIKVGDGKQTISFLPIHRDFQKTLPFCPLSNDDMDGQIIVTTIVASLAEVGSKVDGTLDGGCLAGKKFTNVTLLTNDNGLAIRAREYGLKTSRYGYKYPEPYTGRRDLIVPKDMLLNFFATGRIELEDWKASMPEQPELVANEFIVMRLKSKKDYPSDYNPDDDQYFGNIGRYDVKERAIVRLKYVRSSPVYPKSAGQAIYAEALMDSNIAAIVCTGPAGSGKTYMATIYGYKASKDGDYIGVTVVPCESHSSIGALPGDLDEKMDPDVRSLKNALRNYLLDEDKTVRKERKKQCEGKNVHDNPADNGAEKSNSVKSKLKDRIDNIWENWFSNIPIENARGCDFSYEIAIYDEFQDQSAMQADTLIKRIGREGKIILTGDIEQIHSPYLDKHNNGLVYASKLLLDNPMVAQVHFTEDEVVRHPLVKEVAKRQKAAETTDDAIV